jgi:hypothetical protein
MTKIGEATTESTSAKIEVKKLVKTRYVLVWLTALPPYAGDQYSPGPGFKQGVTDVAFKN